MNPSQDTIRTIAVYCRVSSDNQREKRTIDSQVSTLTAYAQRHGYDVDRIYQDDGFSGSTIAGRPAFRQLLIDCAKHRFEAILVVEHNRITRSENPEEVGKIQRTLMENHIRIISPPEGVLDLKRPPDELVAWIKMWIAKEEKREIARKMQRGKREGLRKGKWTAGRPPFGYQYEKTTNQWDFHLGEKKLYLWMVERFVAEKWSLTQICAHLQRRGIKSKYGKNWTHSTLNYMFRNPAYKGALYGNKYKYEYDPIAGRSQRVGTKSEEEWIKIDIPAMISAETWKQVQERLEANRGRGRPVAENRLLLQGILRCGHCGSKLYGQYGARPEHHYYCCHNRRAAKHKRSTKGRKRCRLPYIRSDQLDDFIFRYTARVLREPDLLLEQVFSEEHRSERLSELKTSKERLESEHNRHQERLDRLIDLYADGQFDRLTLDRKTQTIKKEMRKVAHQLERSELEREEIERGKVQQIRARKKLQELKKDGLGSYLEQRAEGIDFQDRRRLLQTFFQSSNDYIAISGRRGSLKGSGSRPSLDCEWRSMFDFNLMKIAGEEVQSGRMLSEALDAAEARRIYLTDEWTHLF